MNISQAHCIQFTQVAIVAIGLFFANVIAAFSAQCQAHSIRGLADRGTLVVSEFVLTKDFDACPAKGETTAIAVTTKQHIFVWLRLEGDSRFASKARSSDRFNIRLHREGTLKEHWSLLDLNNSQLAIAGVREEASLPGNNGFFDWRLYAEIKAYLVPGTYHMFVSFGRNRVCQAKGSCEIVFVVKEGE